MRAVPLLVLLSFAVNGCLESAASLPAGKPISPDGVRHASLKYSPDGSKVAWWSAGEDSTAAWQLWMANADLSQAKRLPVVNLFGCSPAGSCPVVWSPDGSRIAAQSSNFALATVVVTDTTGAEPRPVTTGRGYEYPVMWHPDGDRLLYNASAEGGTFTSFVVAISTGATAPLIPEETLPLVGLWSPDGSRIAYSTWDGPRATIWVADSTGGTRRQLTDEGFESFQNNRSPWAPDGQSLLYESRRMGNSDLWLASLDGSEPRQLTRDVRHDNSGAWSSDGEWIAFVSQRGRQTDIWVVSPRDGREWRVTDTPEEESMPTWRPGTHELSFIATNSQSSLWAISADEGSERQLTPDSLRAAASLVSDDGSQVAVVIDRGGGSADIAIVPAGGGPIRTLVSGSGAIEHPVWSPDGTRIAFASDRGGTWDPWVVSVQDGSMRRLADWPSWEWNLTWTADGSGIYFASDRETRLGDLWLAPADSGEPRRFTRHGAVFGVERVGGGLVGLILGDRAGEFELSIIRPDGSPQSLNVRNACCFSSSRSGDRIAVTVAGPRGTSRSSVITPDGKVLQEVLGEQETIGPWSPDGNSILFTRAAVGGGDIGIHDLRTGAARMLTSTRLDEQGPEWAENGSTVVVRRRNSVQRIIVADLSRQLR
jgi:Tol biopolymer transport system component